VQKFIEGQEYFTAQDVAGALVMRKKYADCDGY
jgi:hypothetical protein